MPNIRLDEGLSLHCAIDDYLWPWEASTPVLMMHGFARNATFWNRWVPPIAESRRIYRPDLLGCGASDVPASGYHVAPEQIAAMIVFLSSDLASNITGAQYVADGGRTATGGAVTNVTAN